MIRRLRTDAYEPQKQMECSGFLLVSYTASPGGISGGKKKGRDLLRSRASSDVAKLQNSNSHERAANEQSAPRSEHRFKPTTQKG